MPTYVYKNLKTGAIFEVEQRIVEDAWKTHPETGDPVERVIQAAGIVFKGSGFYKTDSRPAEKSGKAAGKAESSPGASDSGSSGSGSSGSGDSSSGGSSDSSSAKADSSGSASKNSDSGNSGSSNSGAGNSGAGNSDSGSSGASKTQNAPSKTTKGDSKG
jgi:predicted nucleic acid-binding Zn ribbon protein